MASKKQMLANRSNALRSVGPKTPAGKRAVRWNALKHGLLSKEVVITAGDGRESKSEFKTLLTHLQEDLRPHGVLEEMLVEKIAVCYWRLRRVLRCELGEIRRDLDNAKWDEEVRRIDEVAHHRQTLLLNSSKRNLQKSSYGLKHLIGVLENVQEDVRELGNLPSHCQEQLTEAFGNEEGSIAYWCAFLTILATKGPELVREHPEEYSDPPSPERCNKAILKLLDEEKAGLEKLKDIIADNEQSETDAKIASLALPSKDAVDKILRYETTIERQLYRAMTQLERLQRMRSGESVPMPISVEVSQDR